MNYDKTNPLSIEQYALGLVCKTFQQVIDECETSIRIGKGEHNE